MGEMAKHRQRLVKLPDGTMGWVDGSPDQSTNNRSGAGWPIAPDGIGVAPDQVKEYQDYYEANGCGHVRHTPDGRPVLESREHASKVYRALGVHNNDEIRSH